MTDGEIDQLLAADSGGCGLGYDADETVIPAPRSGKAYELFVDEVWGWAGCLDAPHR